MSMLSMQINALQQSLDRYGPTPSDVIYAETLAKHAPKRERARIEKRIEVFKAGKKAHGGTRLGTITSDVMALFKWTSAHKSPPTWTMAGIVKALPQHDCESVKRSIRQLRNRNGLLVWCGHGRMMASASSGLAEVPET